MNTPKGAAPQPILFDAAPDGRPPLSPRVETRPWNGREVDAYTVDRGAAHGFILANIYLDGELLFSRRVPYAPAASGAEVEALMTRHHSALLQDLASGALDLDLQAVLAATARSRSAPPPAPLPPPTPAPLPQKSFTYVFRPGSTQSDELPLPPATPPSARPAPAQASATRGRAVMLGEPGPAAGAPPRATAAAQGGPGSTPPHLRVVLEKPADLLPMLFSTSGGLGLRVQGTINLGLGAGVEVALWFKGRPLRQFQVRGMLAARRPARAGEKADDLAITVPEAERTSLDLAVEFARGILDPAVDRKSPRIACRFPARVVTATGAEMPAVVMNLSEGGAMLGSMPPLPAGSRLTLHLERPGHPPIAVPSDVKWFRLDGMPLTGIQFVHGDVSRTRVGDLVTSLLGSAAPP